MKFCKSGLFCELDNEKTLFPIMEERNSVLFLIFTMGLFSAALSYLTAQSTLNFTWTSLYFKIKTQIQPQRSNIWIKKQPFISRSAVQKGFGRKVSGLQFHWCFILYECFWGFCSHFSDLFFCRTSHNLIYNTFAILRNKKLTEILEIRQF